MTFKVLYTSDLHGNKDFYRLLIKKANEPEINAVIIGGDLSPRGGDTIEEWIQIQKEFLENYFIPELSKLNKSIYFIFGNDDLRKNAEIFDKEYKNLHFIHKKCEKVHNKNIVGYGIVNPTPFRLKDWEKLEDNNAEQPPQMFDHEIRTVEKEQGTIEEDLNQLKKISDPKETIYVMHAPPFETKLDIITTGHHVGSKQFRMFIENEQPLLTLHGHIHESPEQSGTYKDQIGNTVCINVGSSYPEIKLNCIIIDLDTMDITYEEIV